MSDLSYLSGFGNYFSTEAIPGALPIGQNSPQQVPYGLYAEQLSGSAFTAPRHHNLRSWLYRIRPSVCHAEYTPYPQTQWSTQHEHPTPPSQLRWDPLPYPSKPTDFIAGVQAYADNSNAGASTAAIYCYACNLSMSTDYFYSADGELLLIPQEGSLRVETEFGTLSVSPGHIAVIPRGIKFQVLLLEDRARGYLCENRGLPFRLPELGPIGANGLANPRDFLYPTAKYQNCSGTYRLITKFQDHFWQAELDHSPFNVVAWHGNYAPYCYDLRRFNTINTVSYDHPDPSIFTVLTSPSAILGTANLDFVIFPERWMVAEHTFRPPYYHRNIMSEWMGLITGAYDAKGEGFLPGGASLHNALSAHGPDANAYEHALNTHLKPEYYQGTLAFMLESQHVWHPSAYAMQSNTRKKNYLDCWQPLKTYFSA